ncbi:hypothetical protein [Chlorobium phaeobacteroides]|uniref:Uncharacterized protein n=1 Tax=Chlorobium phaeobacteroides (strain DSM 266 / SMG 266 / 2430) TaxID=290317 RepID=A1BD58_CHLPD|nr:hypothetical protein [Chlorobium phaeobacteroides]ABL64335.1 hypothetical protein Cpha266_0271 [Chlorobium phaeobacteroides DSM 266]
MDEKLKLITSSLAVVAAFIGLIVSVISLVRSSENKQSIVVVTQQVANVEKQVKDVLIKSKEVVIAFNDVGAIKHIIKDIPSTPYPPYHDRSRIRPSSDIPVYSFPTATISFAQGVHFNKYRITFAWQYHADSNYDPATVEFKVKYPADAHTPSRIETVSKSYQEPLKIWQTATVEINVPKGIPPESLQIFVPQSGDFDFMIKDMHVEALFGEYDL